MDCAIARDTLAALAEGCAGDEERRLLEDHLRHCASCDAEARHFEDLRRRLFAAARDVAPVDVEAAVMREIRGRLAERPMAHPTRRGVREWLQVATTGRGLRLAGAGLLGAVVVALVIILSAPPPTVWALDDSIEATRRFLGVYMSAAFDGHQNCEIWVRANDDQSQMRNMLLRTNGTTVWVDGNTTSYYERGSDIVYSDDAQTAGFSHWPGSRLFEVVRATGTGRVTYATDPITGHRRAIVEASILDGSGAASLVMEFDAETKLLVGLKTWKSLSRSGTPSFETRKIVYFEDLPDEVFTVDLPRDVIRRQKEVTVAPELIGLLSLPQHGIPVPGMSQEDAVRRIAREMWTAAMDMDLPRIRQLAPVASAASDELVRVIVAGVGGNDRVVEIVDIGKPALRGHCQIGPLWVVPARTRHKDGHLYDEKIVVLYRPNTDPASCVVHTGYGPVYRIDG